MTNNGAICIHERDSKCKIYVVLFGFWRPRPRRQRWPLDPAGRLPSPRTPKLFPNLCLLATLLFLPTGFYRAMHFSAKRGIAIACLSVCLSVCDVGGSGSHTLQTNCTDT